MTQPVERTITATQQVPEFHIADVVPIWGKRIEIERPWTFADLGPRHHLAGPVTVRVTEYERGHHVAMWDEIGAEAVGVTAEQAVENLKAEIVRRFDCLPSDAPIEPAAAARWRTLRHVVVRSQSHRDSNLSELTEGEESVASLPHRRWMAENQAELERHRGKRVAIHPSRGIVAVGDDYGAVHDELEREPGLLSQVVVVVVPEVG